MLTRRHLLAAPAALSLAPIAAQAQGSFSGLLSSVAAEARGKGISDVTIERAFAGVTLNQKILELYHHQPEFTLTWAQYRARVITGQKIANGRAAYRQNARTFYAVDARYGVTAGVIVGIWGIESAYGQITGSYGVVEALATLAWEGRRASFFRTELIDALRILQHGDVAPGADDRQLRRRDGAAAIHARAPSCASRRFRRRRAARHLDSTPDVLGSIANYLARSGWRYGEPWGQPVQVPPGLDPAWPGGTTASRSANGWRSACAGSTARPSTAGMWWARW